jgi:hypothetical protein
MRTIEYNRNGRNHSQNENRTIRKLKESVFIRITEQAIKSTKPRRKLHMAPSTAEEEHWTFNISTVIHTISGPSR